MDSCNRWYVCYDQLFLTILQKAIIKFISNNPPEFPGDFGYFCHSSFFGETSWKYIEFINYNKNFDYLYLDFIVVAGCDLLYDGVTYLPVFALL